MPKAGWTRRVGPGAREERGGRWLKRGAPWNPVVGRRGTGLVDDDVDLAARDDAAGVRETNDAMGSYGPQTVPSRKFRQSEDGGGHVWSSRQEVADAVHWNQSSPPSHDAGVLEHKLQLHDE